MEMPACISSLLMVRRVFGPSSGMRCPSISAADIKNRAVSTPSRNVLFCQVEMSYRRFAGNPPFLSCCTVLHRGQPSRLPFGAKAGGLDGTRPRCGGLTVMRGMAGLF